VIGERTESLDIRIQHALLELQSVIAQHYPSTRFAVTRSAEEPENIHLLAEVDTNDTDAVLDLVIDRVVDLQVDERIPVHVIPIRTPERIQAELLAAGAAGRRRFGHGIPLFEKLPSVRR